MAPQKPASPAPDGEPFQGTWWYNQGKSYYTITKHSGRLAYHQWLPEGQELFGYLQFPFGQEAAAGGWIWEAELSNKAKIRFRLDKEGRMVTTYQRAGTWEWRAPNAAERGPPPPPPQPPQGQPQQARQEERRKGEDGNWYTQADFVGFYGGNEQWSTAEPEPAPPQMVRAPSPGLPGEPSPGGAFAMLSVPPMLRKPVSRGPPQTQVSPAMLASYIRKAVLRSWVDPEVAATPPLSVAASVRRILLGLLPTAHVSPVSVFDRFTILPMVERMDEEDLEQHQLQRSKRTNPKTTIVAVPSYKFFGGGLAHPVSFNEEQMLRLFVTDPRNLAYNLASMFRNRTLLSVEQLELVHKIILDRHDVLRSIFRFDDPKNPVRKVMRELPGGFYTLLVATERDTQRVQLMDYGAPHALGVRSMRAMQFPSHDNVGALAFNIHHILGDADAMASFWEESFAVQEALGRGASREVVMEMMPKLAVQFVDFAYWQKSLHSQGLLDSDIAHWSFGITNSTPPSVLDLPLDLPRPRVWTAVGDFARCAFDQELVTPVNSLLTRATPFSVIFCSFCVALSRMSGCPFTYMAVPFALRSLPALRHVIGNFLNMLPTRVKHDPSEPYLTMLARVATAAIDVQKYSLAPFINIVSATQRHYPTTDPSRNPVYQTMIDLVPNDSEDGDTGLKGVMDIFLFACTRQGVLWRMEAVYNTFVLERQSANLLLMHILAISRHAAREPHAPIPRTLPIREEGQARRSGAVELTHVMTRAGLLPRVTVVKSGWELEGAPDEYFGIRRARRFKHHSALEFCADFPPEDMKSLPVPGVPRRVPPAALAPAPAPALEPPKAKPAAPVLAVSQAIAPAPSSAVGAVVQLDEAAEAAEAAEARRARIAGRRARTYEVAARWAETQRVSELIPLDTPDFGEDMAEQLAGARHRQRAAAAARVRAR